MKIILFICLFPLFVFGGGAINFDGVDDYVVVGNTFNMGLDDQTQSAWIKTTATQLAGIAGKGYLTSNASGMGIFLRETGHFDVNLRLSGGISIAVGITPETIVNDGKWHFVVGVADRGSATGLKLYIDGELKATADITSLSSDTLTSSHYFAVGSVDLLPGHTSYGRFFDGEMGIVQVWGRVLSLEEIKAIYVSKNAWYPKNGLVSRWSMEKNGVSTGQSHANGSTIKDSVGSNNGTIVDGSDNSMTLESSPTRKKRGRR